MSNEADPCSIALEGMRKVANIWKDSIETLSKVIQTHEETTEFLLKQNTRLLEQLRSYQQQNKGSAPIPPDVFTGLEKTVEMFPQISKMQRDTEKIRSNATEATKKVMEQTNLSLKDKLLQELKKNPTYQKNQQQQASITGQSSNKHSNSNPFGQKNRTMIYKTKSDDSDSSSSDDD